MATAWRTFDDTRETRWTWTGTTVLGTGIFTTSCTTLYAELSCTSVLEARAEHTHPRRTPRP
jgi:hypothetical protein